VKIAILGIAHWHYALALEIVAQNPEDVIVGVSDPDTGLAEREGRRLNCKWSNDFRELCRSTSPDFVFALGRHRDMASEGDFLLDEGIPFALQKPCGLNYKEVAALAKKADRKHAFATTEGLAYRHAPVYETIRKLAGNDRFHHISFRWLVEPHSRILSMAPWVLDREQAGGGCVLISTPHIIDLFRLVAQGSKLSVRSATLSSRAEGNQVEDYALYTIVSEAGLVCNVEMDAGYVGVYGDRGVAPDRARFVYQTFSARTDGHYFLAPDVETLQVTDLRKWRATKSIESAVETVTVSGHIANGMRTAGLDILARVRDGRAPTTSLWDMAEVMKLIDAVYAHGGMA